MEPPSGVFLFVAVFWNDFTVSWKPLKAFGFLNKMRYVLGVVALLEACDVTNNGSRLVFYQELKIISKPLEMVIFCALHEK